MTMLETIFETYLVLLFLVFWVLGMCAAVNIMRDRTFASYIFGGALFMLVGIFPMMGSLLLLGDKV